MNLSLYYFKRNIKVHLLTQTRELLSCSHFVLTRRGTDKLEQESCLFRLFFLSFLIKVPKTSSSSIFSIRSSIYLARPRLWERTHKRCRNSVPSPLLVPTGSRIDSLKVHRRNTPFASKVNVLRKLRQNPYESGLTQVQNDCFQCFFFLYSAPLFFFAVSHHLQWSPKEIVWSPFEQRLHKQLVTVPRTFWTTCDGSSACDKEQSGTASAKVC